MFIKIILIVFICFVTAFDSSSQSYDEWGDQDQTPILNIDNSKIEYGSSKFWDLLKTKSELLKQLKERHQNSNTQSRNKTLLADKLSTQLNDVIDDVLEEIRNSVQQIEKNFEKPVFELKERLNGFAKWGQKTLKLEILTTIVNKTKKNLKTTLSISVDKAFQSIIIVMDVIRKVHDAFEQTNDGQNNERAISAIAPGKRLCCG